MTLPIHMRMLMVAEALTEVVEGALDADAHGVAQRIESEVDVLQGLAAEIVERDERIIGILKRGGAA